MSKMKYYIAYGSNLSVKQMAHRCPDSRIAGQAVLEGWELLFKGCATIEPNKEKNTSITQHVRSVLDNEDARRMLSDCGYIKLLNQSPDDANDLARLLHISNEEKRYIENAEVGSGLLIVSKTVVPFNNDFPKDTELFRLMDTSPNRKS